MASWLMKSEPEVYGLDDLARDRTNVWDGVRNYVSRNHLKAMRVGDRAFFYHSGPAPAIVGILRITKPAHPDPGQFDPQSDYYDPGAKRDDPRWVQVGVAFAGRLARPVPLARLRAIPALRRMVLFTHTRLSVSPVRPAEWRIILGESRRPAA